MRARETDETQSRSEVDWKRFLATGTPREVLARLVDGDPLGVRAVVAERLKTSRRLLDAERVSLRTFARVARFACRYRGRPEFSTWLAECCDDAIDDILDEEREAAVSESASAAAPSEAFALLAEPLGIDSFQARRACVAIHDCTFEERDAFFEIVLAARSLDDVAQEKDCAPTLLARRARRVLLAILRPEARELEVLP